MSEMLVSSIRNQQKCVDFLAHLVDKFSRHLKMYCLKCLFHIDSHIDLALSHFLKHFHDKMVQQKTFVKEPMFFCGSWSIISRFQICFTKSKIKFLTNYCFFSIPITAYNNCVLGRPKIWACLTPNWTNIQYPLFYGGGVCTGDR